MIKWDLYHDLMLIFFFTGMPLLDGVLLCLLRVIKLSLAFLHAEWIHQH